MPDSTQTWHRAVGLLTILTVAMFAVACGRATDDEINQALGITPTATASVDQLATSSAVAVVTRDARTAAAVTGLANLGGSPAAVESVAVIGDVSRGRSQFTLRCALCHNPGGKGGNLLAVGGPGASASYDDWLPMIRDGTGHPKPPGPFPPSVLTDRQLQDLVAFVEAQAGA